MKQPITQEMIDNLPWNQDVYDGSSTLHIHSSTYTKRRGWWIEPIDYHLFADQSGLHKIGTYPEMSLAQARAAYKEYLEGVIKEATEKLAYENTKGE